MIIRGDALDLIQQWPSKLDLIATDPPYAFGGAGMEHAISATVAVVLRESAKKLKPGGWMVVFAAASWRSTAYMVEALRGEVEPVRIATWCKPGATSKAKIPGWAWGSVNVIAFRNGKSAPLTPCPQPDWIACEPVRKGRRAELPAEVAEWAVAPFTVAEGTMLDPFAGSGALVWAAKKFGMDATGFEVQDS